MKVKENKIDWSFLINARYIVDHPEMLAKMPADKREVFDGKLAEQERLLRGISHEE